MTKAELTLVAEMLNDYADRLSNDGCNDMELPDTPENRELSLPDGETVPHLYRGKVLAMNNVVARKLAEKAQADAGLPF